MITKEQEKRLMKLRKAREIKIQFYIGKKTRTRISLTILEIIILGLIILGIIWLSTKL